MADEPLGSSVTAAAGANARPFVIHGRDPADHLRLNGLSVHEAFSRRPHRRACAVSGKFRVQRRRRTMHWALRVAMLACGFVAAGCRAPSDRYIAAAAISEYGFARNADDLRRLQGSDICVWGFVDHGNLYGDADARRILGASWSGEGPNPDIWRFGLKAEADDPVGHSFPVHVRNDAGRDALLAAFRADAESGRPTRVFLQGRLRTYAAPTHFRSLTGIVLEVPSSSAIRLHAPGP